MPIFDYTCKQCENKFEKIVKKFDDEVTCPECEQVANREVSAPGAYLLKGEGYEGRTFISKHRKDNKRMKDPFEGYDAKAKATDKINKERAKRLNKVS